MKSFYKYHFELIVWLGLISLRQSDLETPMVWGQNDVLQENPIGHRWFTYNICLLLFGIVVGHNNSVLLWFHDFFDERTIHFQSAE